MPKESKEDTDAEEVTRDTHGYSQPTPVSNDEDTRVEEADRAAAAAGIPGAVVPEPETTAETIGGQEQTALPPSTDESGDRAASRRDVEKLRSKRS